MTSPPAYAGHRKIVHIRIDAFYASVAQRDDPRLAERPVLVIDEAGGDDEAVGVHDARTLVGIDMADFGDDARTYADVGPVAGNPSSNDDGSILDDEVEFRQRFSPDRGWTASRLRRACLI